MLTLKSASTAKTRQRRPRNTLLNAVSKAATETLDRTFSQVPLQQYQASKLILRSATTVATNGLGIINSTIPMDPSAAVGWAEVSNYYDEFRVIGARLQIYCSAPNSITRISDIAMVVFDNDDSASLTGTGQAYAYADKLVLPSIFTNSMNGIAFSATRPATKSSPTPWVDVQAPASSLGAFKWYSEVLDISTVVFRVYYEYYLEVRGRR